MSEKPLQTITPESAVAEQAKHEKAPWKPRVRSDCELNTNPFERFDSRGCTILDGTSLNGTVAIRDATQDTAPLQGSKDISDDDYLGGGGA